MTSSYAGYVRTKSRQQAQDNDVRGQERFDGGLDSDTPPNKIATNELARSINTVHFPDRVEGHYGRKLAASWALPGTGTRWDLKQHPVTGRWLLARGGQLWLSEGREQAGWVEVTVIGPDGSLTASGSFTDGTVTLSGAVAGFISDMVLAGVTPGQTVYIQAEADAGLFIVRVYSDVGMTTLIASGSISDATVLPAPVTLTQQGGSGVSGTVSMDVNPSGSVRTGSGVVAEYELTFTFRGLTTDNTDSYTLYWNAVVVDATDVTLMFYKDAGKTQLVASAEFDSTSPAQYEIVEENGSGLSGSFLSGEVSGAAGTFGGTPLEFTVAAEDIDAGSVISFHGDTGFVVFVRGATDNTRHTIYVDQTLVQYWFLSTPDGYGAFPFVGNGADPDFDDYIRRYLYTFSRIVNHTTRQPAPSGNRITDALTFEGPSNLIGSSNTEVDYSSYSSSDAFGGTPVNLVLSGAPSGPIVPPIGADAAAYITHISIYGTLNIGLLGIGLNGVANNSELYIWIADIPISSLTYSDTTSDEVLLNRFAGGSTQGENFALRSRFFREMARGIGCIRPDFMATVTPQGTRINYCDVAVNPRFIGYYFPGSQYFLTQDPVSDLVTTKDLLVALCPSSNYTSVTAINVDAGITGVSYIPVIQNFEKSSQTVGIKYGQRTFQVDDNSFVSLCSDGTVRVYSASFWGDPLDGDQVHKLVELAQVGAVLIYLRDVLYMWYTEDSEAEVTDKCLRYGAGGQAGNRWSVIDRENWVWPPVGGGMAAVWEDDDAALRMLVIDDEADVAFAIEDLPPLRQYVDDVITEYEGLAGPAAQYLEDMVLTGAEAYPALYFRIMNAGSGFDNIVGYLTEADREANTNAVVEGTNFQDTDLPIDDYVLAETNGSGINGTVDILDTWSHDNPNRDFFYAIVPFIEVTGTSDIASTLRFRQLTGTQQQFQCFHQESYTFVRAVYGMDMPTVKARWYANGVLVPESEQVGIPVDGDIQSLAQVKGRTIQLEIEPQSSGWQLTGWNTKYQTQDMRSANGPWNSAEASLQRELAVGLVAWLNGQSGLINRASSFNARFVGAMPTPTEAPTERLRGQSFATPVTFADVATLNDFSIMFWVNTATLGAAGVGAPVAILNGAGTVIGYITFTNTTTADIGGFSHSIDPSVAAESGWQHFCMTRNSTTFSLYQNGLLVHSAAVAPASLAGASFRVGCSAGVQNLFDPRIYETCLSADAVLYYFQHQGQVP